MTLASSTRSVGHRMSNSASHGATRARKPAFYLLTAAFFAFLLFALRGSMAMLLTAWTSGYAFPAHRVHHVMIGGMLTVFTVLIAVQLYRPTKRVGAIQAVVAFVIAAFALTLVASGVAAVGEIMAFVIPVLLIALLHPARDHIVPTLERVDRRLLALGGIGAIGFGAVAVAEYLRHTGPATEHVLFGHHEFLLFTLVSIGLFAILGALRPTGWRALVYSAAGLATLFAVASLAYPGIEQGSSLGTIGALAVIVWAVAYVGLAESVGREDSSESDRRAATTA